MPVCLFFTTGCLYSGIQIRDEDRSRPSNSFFLIVLRVGFFVSVLRRGNTSAHPTTLHESLALPKPAEWSRISAIAMRLPTWVSRSPTTLRRLRLNQVSDTNMLLTTLRREM
jgi:hypothetical protein